MTKWSEYLTKMELWRTSLRKIEGNFGTGVVAYFVFLRWLMILNFLVFSIIFMFIILPQLILKEPKDLQCDPVTPPVESWRWIKNDSYTESGFNETIWLYGNRSVECCRDSYLKEVRHNRSEFSILNIVQGTGFMEMTLLFYGKYTNKIFGYDPVSEAAAKAARQSQRIFAANQNKERFNVDDINSTTSPIMSALLSHNDDFDAIKNLTQSWKHFLDQLDIYYDLPLAYIIVTIVCYLYTLIAIVKAVAHEFKDRLVEGEGQFYQYCNLIFGGWDFCIHNQKSAQIKHKALSNEIQSLMHLKRYEVERNNRTRDIMIKLYLIRIMVNIFVCIILVICGIVIYILFNVSFQYLENKFTFITRYRNVNVFMSKFKKLSTGEGSEDVDKQFEILFYEFLPYVSIVIFNLLVPILFNYLIQFEQYSPIFVIKMNLFRTVGLRLSSLAVLISRFYFLVTNQSDNPHLECYNINFGTPQCWETFVGQQFYKLFIVDFVTHIFVTFFVNFPRALIARNMNNAFARFIEMDFELSKHVLDIVYSQTICWLGTFYAPFLPAIAGALMFFMFYIKKFACLVNSKPSSILYRASRSKSLFMIVLLFSFTISIIPVVYAIAEIMPSRSCGPFRGLNSTWDCAIGAFMKLPEFLQGIIFFFGTSSFAIPSFIVLILFLYYYYSVSAANKHMVQVLKNQLVLEGHDKQFLLNRLSLFIKQQQEYQKRMQRQFFDHNSTTNNSQVSQQYTDTIPPPLLPRAPRTADGGSSERSSMELKQHKRTSDIGDV